MALVETAAYRGPESPLIDCWTVGALDGAVVEAVKLATRAAAAEVAATDAARGAEFARWVESVEVFDDRTHVVPAYAQSLTA